MSANNPFSLALNFQRELFETATESVDNASIAAEQAERIEDVEVGQTPSNVVYEENKLELLHYESRTDEQHGTPILIVYALINKPFILDLQPDRSVVRRLLDAGHDVYLIDWNEPCGSINISRSTTTSTDTSTTASTWSGSAPVPTGSTSSGTVWAGR